MTPKILILHYSHGGKTTLLAQEIQLGAAEMPDVNIVLKTIPNSKEDMGSITETGLPYA